MNFWFEQGLSASWRPVSSATFLWAGDRWTRSKIIMRDEINAIGGQEITMPVVNPADLWQETGRWYQVGPELTRLKDRSGRDMVLAMTHEEVVADLIRKEIKSYRQLPQLIYHIQTKWRDDPRPRAWLDQGARVHDEGQLQPGCGRRRS